MATDISLIIPYRGDTQAVLTCVRSATVHSIFDSSIEAVIVGTDLPERMHVPDSQCRIKLIRQIEPVGIPAAYAAGMEVASGTFVCLCTDDVLFPKYWDGDVRFMYQGLSKLLGRDGFLCIPCVDSTQVQLPEKPPTPDTWWSMADNHRPEHMSAGARLPWFTRREYLKQLPSWDSSFGLTVWTWDVYEQVLRHGGWLYEGSTAPVFRWTRIVETDNDQAAFYREEDDKRRFAEKYPVSKWVMLNYTMCGGMLVCTLPSLMSPW